MGEAVGKSVPAFEVDGPFQAVFLMVGGLFEGFGYAVATRGNYYVLAV